MGFNLCSAMYSYVYFNRIRSLERKLSSAVRETALSRHNGGLIEGPLIPPNITVLWWPDRFQGDPQLGSHDAERRLSLGQLYVCFPDWQDRQWWRWNVIPNENFNRRPRTIRSCRLLSTKPKWKTLFHVSVGIRFMYINCMHSSDSHHKFNHKFSSSSLI